MRGPFDEVMRRQEVEDKRLAREMRKYDFTLEVFIGNPLGIANKRKSDKLF